MMFLSDSSLRRCEFWQDQLALYNSLTDRERLALSTHVTTCVACRKVADSYQRVRELLQKKAMPQPPALPGFALLAHRERLPAHADALGVSSDALHQLDQPNSSAPLDDTCAEQQAEQQAATSPLAWDEIAPPQEATPTEEHRYQSSSSRAMPAELLREPAMIGNIGSARPPHRRMVWLIASPGGHMRATEEGDVVHASPTPFTERSTSAHRAYQREAAFVFGKRLDDDYLAALLNTSTPAPQQTSYRSEAAQVCAVAYRCLTDEHTSRDDFTQAADWAYACLQRPLTPRERIGCTFVVGLNYSVCSHYSEALAFMYEALDIAWDVHDPQVVAEVAFRCGEFHAALECGTQATTQYNLASESIANVIAERGRPEAAAHARVQLALATQNFFAAAYVGCERNLSEAQRHLRSSQHATVDPEEMATITWLNALAYRWKGMTSQAFMSASQTASVYEALPLSPALGRIHSVLADIALDLANSVPCGTARDAFLQSAALSIQKALRLAEVTADKGGKGLAILAAIRFNLVRRQTTGDDALVDAVLRLAHECESSALLGQTYTALGYAEESQGDVANARALYVRAIDILDEANLKALSAWPRRAILTLEEMCR